MSFDLAVWSHVPRTTKDAQSIYERLCDGDTSALQPHATAHADMRAFLAELTARYPTDNMLPEDRIDECAWSASFDLSDASVIMPMPYSRANEIMPFVAMLAVKNNLTLYNPQGGTVLLPPKSKAAR